MDEETKKEWEKSKRIEAERMKAVQAAEKDKSTRINSAFLDVKNTELKGYSQDTQSLLLSVEKTSALSLGFAILGVVLRWAGPNILDPSGVVAKVASFTGTVMLGAAIISAIVVLGYCFYCRGKVKFDFKNIVFTAIAGLVIALIYIILNFRFMIAEFMV